MERTLVYHQSVASCLFPYQDAIPVVRTPVYHHRQRKTREQAIYAEKALLAGLVLWSLLVIQNTISVAFIRPRVQSGNDRRLCNNIIIAELTN